MKKVLKKLKQGWCALRGHSPGFTIRHEGDWIIMTCKGCDAEFWHYK